jgi:hypothetical protein
MMSTPGDFESEVKQVKAERESARLERLREEEKIRERGEAARQARIIEEAARQARISREIERIEEALRQKIRSALEYLGNRHIPPRHTFSSHRGWIIESVIFCYDHKVTRTREIRNSDYPVGYPNDFAIPATRRVTETFTEWSINQLEGYALCTNETIYTFYDDGSARYHICNPLSPRRVLGIDLSDPLSPRRVQNLDSLAGPNGDEIGAEWLGTWHQKLLDLAVRDGVDPTSGPGIRSISEVEAQAARHGRLRSLIIESGWRPL